jgi:hypothetical protein
LSWRSGVSAGGHFDAPLFGEGQRIEKPQFVRTVAHDQVGAVRRQPPALAGIGKLLARSERRLVVNQRNVRLPGQFEQVVFENRDSFAEVFGRYIALLQHLAGFQLRFANRRTAAQSRCLRRETRPRTAGLA